MSRNFALWAAGALALVVGGTAGLVFRAPAGPICKAGAVAGGAIGGPFEMIDENGVTVTDVDVITEPAIIYFGYTFCPDVCPVDAARNAIAVDILAEQGIDVVPIFITIDPERDTADVLKDYTENFHPKMIGLTGTQEQVRQTAATYRVAYSRQGDDPEYYLMNHSVFSYLVTPDAGFVDFFRREDSPDDMAARISCLLS